MVEVTNKETPFQTAGSFVKELNLKTEKSRSNKNIQEKHSRRGWQCSLYSIKNRWGYTKTKMLPNYPVG